jgi:methionyl aminopeptidase
MTIDNEADLQGLARAGQVVAEARDAMVAAVEPGVSTGELDAVARAVFREYGARSAPRLTYGFPGSTCISVNDEAAHGVPSTTRHLRAGDLVNLDVSAELDGYFSDTGVSMAVGEVSETDFRLLEATRQTQLIAMDSARPGRPLRAIGRAVESSASARGFRVIRNLYGHGIGRGLHEWPSVPSIDDGQRTILSEGLVLAVEPFLSPSSEYVTESSDGWTLCTADGGSVAQFEHTMVVTAKGPLVLTLG